MGNCEFLEYKQRFYSRFISEIIYRISAPYQRIMEISWLPRVLESDLIIATNYNTWSLPVNITCPNCRHTASLVIESSGSSTVFNEPQQHLFVSKLGKINTT